MTKKNFQPGDGFWDKHGPNMIEYLILAGIIALFTFGWSMKNDMSDIQISVRSVTDRAGRTADLVDRHDIDISNMKQTNVTRVELQMTVGRIERGMDRIEDKLEKRFNGGKGNK